MSVTLIAMRLANMRRVHPDMIRDRVCVKCGETVGLYPSGQRVLARYGRHGQHVDVVCEVCHGSVVGATLAPGAEREPFESHPADE